MSTWSSLQSFVKDKDSDGLKLGNQLEGFANTNNSAMATDQECSVNQTKAKMNILVCRSSSAQADEQMLQKLTAHQGNTDGCAMAP